MAFSTALILSGKVGAVPPCLPQNPKVKIRSLILSGKVGAVPPCLPQNPKVFLGQPRGDCPYELLATTGGLPLQTTNFSANSPRNSLGKVRSSAVNCKSDRIFPAPVFSTPLNHIKVELVRNPFNEDWLIIKKN